MNLPRSCKIVAKLNCKFQLYIHIFLWGNSKWWVYSTHYDWTQVCIALLEKEKRCSSFVFSICRPGVLCHSEKWIRAAEEPTTSHFWLLQVTSHKQWHFMGRGSSSFLPGFLSIVLPDLANSMCLNPPQTLLLLNPTTHSSPSRPPSLLNQTAKLFKPEEGKEKVG